MAPFLELFQCDLVTRCSPGAQLYVSSWDVRGFTLEPSMEGLELPVEGQEDTEGCTGDQLADTEKATILPTTPLWCQLCPVKDAAPIQPIAVF